MTTLYIHNAGKQFASGWVFRNLECRFSTGDRIAVTGYNGSGKSTLLQLLSGVTHPDEGSVQLKVGEKEVSPETYYRHITFAAPYIELLGDFTVGELLRLYARFKQAARPLDTLIDLSGLGPHAEKKIRELSSGLQQRLKLLLSMGFRSDLVLLDEPGTNLDEDGLAWFRDLLGQLTSGAILFIASNDPAREAIGCNQSIWLEDHKTT